MIKKEAEEQKALVQWLRAKNIMHFATSGENQGSFTNRKVAIIQEVKAKSMGKVKGVSDIIVLLPNKILFIELKRTKKRLKGGGLSISHTKVSKEQYAFMTAVNKFDYVESAICYGCSEAIEFIEVTLNGKTMYR